MTSKEFQTIKNNIEEALLLKLLNKVNEEAEQGTTVYEIQMLIFKQWEASTTKNIEGEN